jgi:hypothetical protein
MKKFVILLVFVIFVLSGLGASGLQTNISKNNTLYGEQLDQFQETMTEAAIPIGSFPVPENPDIYVQVAQSFVPSLNVINRVELLVGKNSTATLPIVISIREELNEPDLTTIEIQPDQVPTEDYDWVDFDFDDIFIDLGKTYYIVAITANVTDNYYAWGANNISESYVDGCAWVSVDEGNTWTNESINSHHTTPELNKNYEIEPIFEENVTWDMCFRTYGRDNIPPDAPGISGETNGKAGKEYEYIFTGSDSDADELYVMIDWGDNTTSDLLGPYGGSFEFTMKHTWTEQGTYILTAKAKDPFEWGPEGQLTVSMPKNKSDLFSLQQISWLLDHFKDLFPFLTYI